MSASSANYDGGDNSRDACLEKVLAMFPIMEEFGIATLCANFMAAIGWTRTRQDLPDRGGALVTGFDIDEYRTPSETPTISEDALSATRVARPNTSARHSTTTDNSIWHGLLDYTWRSFQQTPPSASIMSLPWRLQTPMMATVPQAASSQ